MRTRAILPDHQGARGTGNFDPSKEKEVETRSRSNSPSCLSRRLATEWRIRRRQHSLAVETTEGDGGRGGEVRLFRCSAPSY
jgi:hypothetical protein